jgi:hypothetical protein
MGVNRPESRAHNLTTCACIFSRISVSLNHLESKGNVQACNRTVMGQLYLACNGTALSLISNTPINDEQFKTRAFSFLSFTRLPLLPASEVQFGLHSYAMDDQEIRVPIQIGATTFYSARRLNRPVYCPTSTGRCLHRR